MNLYSSISESDCWKDIVLKTYPLELRRINFQLGKINIFGNGQYFSNAPYLSYGGEFSEKLLVDKTFLDGISKPVLIKSVQKLNLSQSLQSILVTDYKTFILDLAGGIDEVWNKKVKSKTRNQVRKAEKNEHEIKIGGKLLLDDFYKVISEAWRDLGTPTHSKDFYGNIVEGFTDSSECKACFMIIYIDHKPVSAACLIYNKNIMIHPYAATLKKFNKFSINNILYWNIIKFAIENDVKKFDMGRSRTGQSTVKYKLSWGAEEVQLYYYYFNKRIHKNDEDGKLIKFLIRMWKRLPVIVANFLGPKLIYKVLK